jgi:small GTP-binding protein
MTVDKRDDFLPCDILCLIVDFLPLDIHTILHWEQISKQFFTVAEEYWHALWNKEYSNFSLRANYRFAIIQLHIYNLHTREPFDHLPMRKNEFRVMISGPQGVGKTSLAIRFTKDAFSHFVDPYEQEILHQRLEINGNQFIVEIYDMGGREEFEDTLQIAYKNCDCLFLCCDLARRNQLEEMAEEMTNYTNTGVRLEKQLSVLLCVTKSDLDRSSDDELTMDDIRDFAQQYAIKNIIETSAKENINVDEAFVQMHKIAMHVLQKNPQFLPMLENGKTILSEKYYNKKSLCNMM